MSARVVMPAGVSRAAEQATAGSNAGVRTVRACSDGFAPPDRVLDDLLAVLEADGHHLAPTPRMRAWCNEIRKALEARRS